MTELKWPPDHAALCDEYARAKPPRRESLAIEYQVSEWNVRSAVRLAFKAMGFATVPRYETRAPALHPRARSKAGRDYQRIEMSDREFNEQCARRSREDFWIPATSSLASCAL